MNRPHSQRTRGSATLEQLTLLGAVALGVVVAFASLGSSLVNTLTGGSSDRGTAGGGGIASSGAAPFDPRSSAPAWDPSDSSSPFSGAVDWGTGAGGDEPTILTNTTSASTGGDASDAAGRGSRVRSDDRSGAGGALTSGSSDTSDAHAGGDDHTSGTADALASGSSDTSDGPSADDIDSLVDYGVLRELGRDGGGNDARDGSSHIEDLADALRANTDLLDHDDASDGPNAGGSEASGDTVDIPFGGDGGEPLDIPFRGDGGEDVDARDLGSSTGGGDEGGTAGLGHRKMLTASARTEQCPEGWRGTWCRAKKKAGELFHDYVKPAAETMKGWADSYFEWANDHPWFHQPLRWLFGGPWKVLEMGTDALVGWSIDGIHWLQNHPHPFQTIDIPEGHWWSKPAQWAQDAAKWGDEVGSNFLIGVLEWTQETVDGVTWLGQLPINYLTGEPTAHEFIDNLPNAVLHPKEFWGSLWDDTKKPYVDWWNNCVGDPDVAKCSRSTGQIAPDVVSTVLGVGAVMKIVKAVSNFRKLTPDAKAPEGEGKGTPHDRSDDPDEGSGDDNGTHGPGRPEILQGIPPERIVSDHLPKYVIYTDAAGNTRIRFRAADASLDTDAPAPGRNGTNGTDVSLDANGNPVVLEGQHRTVGAAHGETIPPELGGVPSAPGYLDFAYTERSGVRPGVRADETEIDDVPEVEGSGSTDGPSVSGPFVNY
jgi:hypothetical protein